MKINLEYPYDKDWKHAYLVVNGEGRRTIILYNSKNDISSTSYARYLVSTSLGRYLSEDEHIDHIDDDKTNDNIENLQILTQKENSKKEAKRVGKLLVEIECPMCSRRFTRRKGNSQLVPCNFGRVLLCSKVCNDIYKTKKLSKSEREEMSKNSVVRLFRHHGEE